MDLPLCDRSIPLWLIPVRSTRLLRTKIREHRSPRTRECVSSIGDTIASSAIGIDFVVHVGWPNQRRGYPRGGWPSRIGLYTVCSSPDRGGMGAANFRTMLWYSIPQRQIRIESGLSGPAQRSRTPIPRRFHTTWPPSIRIPIRWRGACSTRRFPVRSEPQHIQSRKSQNCHWNAFLQRKFSAGY